MQLPIYQIDAFTSEIFKGNYAAVVPLEYWLDDGLMQSIATENNLSETAFFVRNPSGVFDIRWFSPMTEIDFCGHATLASAYVIFRDIARQQKIEFNARAVGQFTVRRKADGWIEMGFPLRPSDRLQTPPAAEVLICQQAYIAVYASEQQVRSVVPDLRQLATLGPRDVVVTARGDQHDFVSRYFWPANGGDEDPVTGSIHAALAPLWAERLHKQQLVAMQVSSRGGLLHCQVGADGVKVAGQAVPYLQGTIQVPDAEHGGH